MLRTEWEVVISVIAENLVTGGGEIYVFGLNSLVICDGMLYYNHYEL